MLITTKKTVKQYLWVKRGLAGYGYCEDQGHYQVLIKHWYFCGIPFFKWVIDRVEVPSCAIDAGALGGQVGEERWISPFAQYMKKG